LSEVPFSMSGDQDHLRMPVPEGIELVGEIEAALASQVDVDERHVRAKLLDQLKGFGAVRGDTDYIHSFSLQERACALQEECAVIDDEASQKHYLRIADKADARIPATGNFDALLTK
jgi:hypothetical protein